MSGRPRIAIGTLRSHHRDDMRGPPLRGTRTRFRDGDGRLRDVTARGQSQRKAEALLKQRLLHRPGVRQRRHVESVQSVRGSGRAVAGGSGTRDITVGTKDNYRDDLRLPVRPFFEHYTLGEITTGRVKQFLKGAVDLGPPGGHVRDGVAGGVHAVCGDIRPHGQCPT